MSAVAVAEQPIGKPQENKKAKAPKVLHIPRLVFGIAYLLIGLLGIAALAVWGGLFYDTANESFENWPRLVGSLGASFIGFALLLLSRLTFRGKRPWRKYVLHYPLVLACQASLVFALCQMSTKTGGYLFYFVAFPACVFGGYLADSLWEKATSIIEKYLSK